MENPNILKPTYFVHFEPAIADFNGLRSPSRSRRYHEEQQQLQQEQRNLQTTCAGRKNKDCKNGCVFLQGSCMTVTPSGPTTPSPTPAGGPPPPGPGPTTPSGCGLFSKPKDCRNEGCVWGGVCSNPATSSVSFSCSYGPRSPCFSS